MMEAKHPHHGKAGKLQPHKIEFMRQTTCPANIFCLVVSIHKDLIKAFASSRMLEWEEGLHKNLLAILLSQGSIIGVVQSRDRGPSDNFLYFSAILNLLPYLETRGALQLNMGERHKLVTQDYR